MKKIITALIIVLMVSGTAWGDWITNPDTGKRDYYKDYDEAIANIEAGGLSGVDAIPGDTVDDGKLDSSLINVATSIGLGVASFPNTTFTVSTAGAVSIKANVFQPYSATLADFSEGSPTGTYDLSGATITFGLDASDIPDISGTYATAGHDHTGTYEPADATIMKTGSYANLTAINAVSPSSGYLRYNGSAFVYDTPSGTEHDAVTLGVDADTILGLSTQQITLDTQTANYVFAGPATGEAADPTFRALVAEDIPDLSGTYQTADAVLAALAALENGSGVLTNDGSGNLSWAAGGGSMVYPGAGVPVSTGSAWGTSLTVGTGASNLVQLDESGKLPAVDGSSLTGLFDPASPGEIGGTTPAAATFTTLGAGAGGFSVDADGNLTAKSLNITRVIGQASYSEYYEDPANGDNKVTVTVPASMDSDTTFNLVEVYNSMTTLRDAIGEGSPGSGLPEGGTEGQIIIRGAESAGWGNGDDVTIGYSPTDEYTNTDSTLAGHLAGIAAELAALKLQITTMTEAFNALGLNAFFFTPSTPASYPYYSDTGTFDLFFTITDSSPTYNIYSARYQLDEGGYEGNPLVNTEGNIWRASLVNLDEGSYTLQLEADDDKSPVRNVGESSEYTVVVDTTDPVINLSAGANPTTHDGSGTDTWNLQIGMIEELHTALIQYRLTVDGGETPDWSTWASPWTTTGIPLPEETEDLHIAVKVTDLAGNWDTGGITVAYSGGGIACSGVKGNNATTDAEYISYGANNVILKKITIDCGGTPSSINARTRNTFDSSTEIAFCVYADDNGSPGSRLWYGSPMYHSDSENTTQTLSDTSINYNFSAGDYWIGIVTEASGRWYGSSTTGGTVYRWNSGITFPTPPASLGEPYETQAHDMSGWLVF